MNTPTLLNSIDRCERLPYLLQRWQTPAIRPIAALYEAVEAGLTSPSNAPWEVSEQALYDLATTRGLDSNQTDVLGEAEHLSALASFIVYVLRPEGPWKRPEPLPLPDGAIWTPSAFLSTSESHLRRVVLCSRWDAYRMVEEEHDWRTLEGSIYGVPMNLMVVVLGQERDGRRKGPLSRGWTHPVSKQLRFRKRDGGGFDGAWEQVWREKSDFSKETWLDTLADDGVLPDVVQIHTVETSNRDWCKIALKKLARIREAKELPEESPSMCFDRINPCPFRSCCPRGEEPSESLGFVRLHHPSDITA
jgi:hypothetical protein